MFERTACRIAQTHVFQTVKLDTYLSRPVVAGTVESRTAQIAGRRPAQQQNEQHAQQAE
jgi:hypothetical protein